MAYNSLTYLIFLVLVGILYFILPKKRRWGVLLGASYIFYLMNSTFLAVFLLLSSVIIWGFARLMGRNNDLFQAKRKELEKDGRKTLKAQIKKKNRQLMTAAVLLNLAILAFFKYTNFLSGNLNGLFDAVGVEFQIPVLKLVMPLGISFYTLQAVSYVVDVYRGKVKAEHHFGRIALFLSFFPQIVEGPIGRYDQLGSQLYEGHDFNYERMRAGFHRIIWGFLKIMVLAQRCGLLVNTVFKEPGEFQGISVALAILFYTIQIYAEFSGAMDIVLGTAKIFGIEMTENFNQPFFATSVQEFWRRWHITLGTWLRDYVFYSVSLSKGFVSLNKKCKAKLSSHFAKLVPMGIALFLVWFSNGIWHGASWKYVCYGLYYYVILMLGMAFEPLAAKLSERLHIRRASKAYHVFQVLRTCVLVYFGMLIFRAPDLKSAGGMFLSLFRGDGTVTGLGLVTGDFVIIAVVTVLIAVYSYYKEKGTDLLGKVTQLNVVVRFALYLLALFALIIFGVYGEGYNLGTFIYGQF